MIKYVLSPYNSIATVIIIRNAAATVLKAAVAICCNDTVSERSD